MKRVLLCVAVVLLSAVLLSACGGVGGNAAPLATSNNLYVNVTTGLDTNAGTLAAPFKTITKGLASAATLSTATNVNVVAGTYNAASGETFPLNIPTHTNLIGSGTVNIDGAGNYTVTAGDRNGSVISTTVVFAPGVTGSMSGITANGSALTIVVADNATVTLSNNSFTMPISGSFYPLWIVNGSVATITANTITGWVAIDTADASTKVIARNNNFDGGYTICTADFTSTASQLDLGTAASPGNNTILRSGGGDAGVNNWGGTGDAGVTAVGNTWTPSVQGADASGHYAAQLIAGSTAVGPNFNIQPTAGIQL